MADDLAPAMRARRGQGMDGALKAVDDMRLPGHFDFERFIVVVPADFAFRHGSFSLWRLSVYPAEDRLRRLHSGCAQAHLPVAFSVCCLVHASLQ
jgi:hypothetical protein